MIALPAAWEKGLGLAMLADRSPGLALSPVILMVLLVGLIKVPAVHADAVDTTFLGALNSKGIDFANGQSAVIAGHEVCDELDSGRQKNDVVSEVMQSSQLDGYHAGFFVGVSVSAFCPRHHG